MIYNKPITLGNNSSSIIEVLKWVAIVAMTSDHVGILFFNHIDIFRMFGRWAFPIFAFVLVYNFMYHSKDKERYIKRIALAALLFEPIHFMVFQNHYAGLNIFFIYTLALSILYLYELVQDDKKTDRKKEVFLLVFVGFSILLSQYIEYYISGLLLTISFYFTLKDKRFIVVTILFLIVLNAPATKYIIATLMLLPIAYLITKINISVPRLKYFFYFYYPLHILLLSVVVNIIKA